MRRPTKNIFKLPNDMNKFWCIFLPKSENKGTQAYESAMFEESDRFPQNLV